MSVTLYEEEKFLRIYQSLHLAGQDLARLWSYPPGWQEPGGMDAHFRSFITDLRRANTATWNRQYSDDPQPFTIPDFDKGVLPYVNDFQLLKSLQGLRYNLISNDGKETNFLQCYDRLHYIIDHLMSSIINELPQYAAAKTW